MFYSLKGILTVIRPSFAVIECTGVGYKINISENTYKALVSFENKEVTAYTYLKVSEDAFELYGFKDETELDLFKMLISVSGVGPKAGIAILSALTCEKLVTAISQGDAKAISKAQGIGSKTAARIVLELKDKVAKGGFDIEAVSELTATESAPKGTKANDVLDTLVVLGYKRGEAQAVIRSIDVENMGLEDAVRAALNKLSRG